MGWMDRVVAFFKSGGSMNKSWSKGTSKSWSTEKTWSMKKGPDAPKSGEGDQPPH